MNLSFGDNVRIKQAQITDELGLSGLIGQIYGETTPSVTGVDVIGSDEEDFAYNVVIDSIIDKSLWFAANLLEFVDHGEGAEIRINGVSKKWVRNRSGEWIEEEV